MENSWEFLRQRNFTGGESLATLPEMVQRSQLIRCMDTILSPEGELTAAWQLDTPLFLNVPGGIVIAPIPGSNLLTVFAASGNNIITFTVDPSSATPYDFAAASGYPGYATRAQANAVNIVGITHGTPYHGKNYCCAATIISAFAGTLTGGPSTIAYGTVAFNSVHQLGTAITNHTAAPITLTNASISGAGAAYYGQSGSFPQVVAPGGSYTIPTTFHPLSAGESDAILSVTCAAGRLDIPMTGSATAALLLSPSSIIAPYSDIGTNSTIGATLYNLNGLSPQVISGVTVTGPFTVLTTFPKTIPAGGALALSLQFTPTAAGDTSGTVTATGSDGTCSANISGTALAPRNLWPNYGLNYDFGDGGDQRNRRRSARSRDVFGRCNECARCFLLGLSGNDIVAVIVVIWLRVEKDQGRCNGLDSIYFRLRAIGCGFWSRHY